MNSKPKQTNKQTNKINSINCRCTLKLEKNAFNNINDAKRNRKHIDSIKLAKQIILKIFQFVMQA